MSLGLGLALANLLQLLLSGFDVRLPAFPEALRAVAPLLLAVGDRRHRLPMYAAAGVGGRA